MLRLTVHHVDESVECSQCGLDMPVVTEVWLDGELLLSLDHHSQCDGDSKWHRADILYAILAKLGYSFEGLSL